LEALPTVKKKHKIYRSSISGEIVSREYAEANPDTTQAETIETGSDNKEDGDEQADTTEKGN
jgi:hypothetical protein